jgi:dTDP-4-amino-4,6-dideoxygalactose transaminase
MKPIQMVDLRTQYHKLKKEIDSAMVDVLESSEFINGKLIADFTKELGVYLNVKHVIPCANGTDALQIALMALDLQPGDEVITPSFTFIATAEVAALLRLKPVFTEVDKKSFCMDPEAVRKAITPRTKAIIPVHLFGQCVDMEAISAIAKEHHLPVIEDNAQAIGSDFHFSDGSVKKAGTIGTIGTTSFFPSKNLGGYGDAGAMFTNDDALAAKLKMIASHGQSKRYYHDVVGCNSRLDTLQAAILKIKLPHLDEYIKARVAVADYYDSAFALHPKITTPYRVPYCTHVFHQYTLLLKNMDRNGLQEYLATKNIPAMIYYPVPGHKQKMFDAYGGYNYELPDTDWLADHVISLPIHTEMDEEQLKYITQNVLEYADR